MGFKTKNINMLEILGFFYRDREEDRWLAQEQIAERNDKEAIDFLRSFYKDVPAEEYLGTVDDIGNTITVEDFIKGMSKWSGSDPDKEWSLCQDIIKLVNETRKQHRYTLQDIDVSTFKERSASGLLDRTKFLAMTKQEQLLVIEKSASGLKDTKKEELKYARLCCYMDNYLRGAEDPYSLPEELSDKLEGVLQEVLEVLNKE